MCDDLVVRSDHFDDVQRLLIIPQCLLVTLAFHPSQQSSISKFKATILCVIFRSSGMYIIHQYTLQVIKLSREKVSQINGHTRVLGRLCFQLFSVVRSWYKYAGNSFVRRMKLKKFSSFSVTVFALISRDHEYRNISCSYKCWLCCLFKWYLPCCLATMVLVCQYVQSVRHNSL